MGTIEAKKLIDKFIELSGLEITYQDIRGRSRREDIAISREAFWYCLSKSGLGTRKIARIAGRKRETVRSGIHTVKNLIETNNPLSHPYAKAIEYFLHQHENK
jgi:chromosomal replication initiation ATPase DnaA